MPKLPPVRESAEEANQWSLIFKKYQKLKEFDPQGDQKKLNNQISHWKKESMNKIESTCKKILKELQNRMQESTAHYDNVIKRIEGHLQERKHGKPSDTKTINSLKKLLELCELDVHNVTGLRIQSEKSNYISPIKLVTEELKEIHPSNNHPPQHGTAEIDDVQEEDSHATASYASPQSKHTVLPSIAPTGRFAATNMNPLRPLVLFRHEGIDKDLQNLTKILKQLSPMDKTTMSGKCEFETSQMEDFLKREFGFENIPNAYLVDGVRDFQLRKSIRKLDPSHRIHFPSNTPSSFEMTVQEILTWQQSYAVYAPKAVSSITKSFLEKALQGKTSYGPEAFLMKFVVRISTCPILMEFDAKVIPRRVTNDWPNLIKLVSVTGVDFACRKHDLDDIRTYIRNWQQVFELDPKHGVPICPNGRDFVVRRGAPPVDLDETRLFRDLKMMARVRLHACDQQKVEIVVETGIGLGVFAGSYIGIDDRVRKLSAKAVREVLETDGGYFTNILAVVFALPIFPSKSDPDGYETSVYKAFIEEFSTSKYRGPVPVMMADQDMHRLAVSIAKFGYCVSELNPADSHGVFGEYWQNRGPAVEEKLALTTLGLLVQHHRINPCVLDQTKYHLI